MGTIAPLLVVVALVAAASWWYRRRTGVAQRIDATFAAGAMRELGLRPGRPALLLFTAPGCAPCTTARRMLDEVAQRRDVDVVVADVTEHHEIAAEQHVYRAPTVFVVDQRGHAVSRITGVPRDGELDDLLQPRDEVAA